MEMQIDPVSEEELDVLKSISEETFIDTYAAQNTPDNVARYVSKAFTSERLLKELNTPNSFFFLARRDGEIAGYLKLNLETTMTVLPLSDALEIERIYVAKTFHGQGIGKALFEFSKNFAREQKKAWLCLGVWERNTKAIRFYERMGLTIFSEHDFEFGTEIHRDLLMRLNVYGET